MSTTKTIIYVDVPPLSAPTGLGKRKRSNTVTDELVLHLSGSDVDLEKNVNPTYRGYRTRSDSEGSSSTSYAPTTYDTSESNDELEETASGDEELNTRHNTPKAIPGSSRGFILMNGRLVPDPMNSRRYACIYPGCEKAYSKPARLKEHERSHTGERPFKCYSCTKSYLRDTHLHAHERVHMPYDERPFHCGVEGCDKRFWTEQHKKRHNDIKHNPNVPRPFKCTSAECTSTFTKHIHLLTHIATAHSTPGSISLDSIQIKPYPCEHSGCGKAFKTRQKLMAHVQVHDGTRYRCSHPSCTEPQYFRTWTALQSHTRTAHPPTCPYPSCNGKTFTQQKGLRAHLKIHENREVEEVLLAEFDKRNGSEEDDDEKRPMKRRRGGEIGRDWRCDVEGCKKDFKSKKALKTHVNVTHLHRRDFTCTYPDCKMDFGYKHLLQRHIAKAHDNYATKDKNDDGADESGAEGDDEEHEEIIVKQTSSRRRRKTSISMDIDTIVGKAYSDRAQERLASHQGILCPFPHLPMDFLLDSSPATLSSSASIALQKDKCEYVFSRAYDFRRHLKATHGVDVEKEKVEQWVKIEKGKVTGA